MTISYFNITSLFSNNFPEISSFKLFCEIGKENMTLLPFCKWGKKKRLRKCIPGLLKVTQYRAKASLKFTSLTSGLSPFPLFVLFWFSFNIKSK